MQVWRGPYGDACKAYRTGGDRSFWCKWDGAAVLLNPKSY